MQRCTHQADYLGSVSVCDDQRQRDKETNSGIVVETASKTCLKTNLGLQ